MAAKVTVLCGSGSHTCARNQAERKVRRGGFRWLNRVTIEEIVMAPAQAAETARQAAYYDGPMGRGNILPFTRVPNRLLKPEPLHYPIPACGAHSRFLSVLKTNFVPEPVQA